LWRTGEGGRRGGVRALCAVHLTQMARASASAPGGAADAKSDPRDCRRLEVQLGSCFPRGQALGWVGGRRRLRHSGRGDGGVRPWGRAAWVTAVVGGAGFVRAWTALFYENFPRCTNPPHPRNARGQSIPNQCRRPNTHFLFYFFYDLQFLSCISGIRQPMNEGLVK